MLEMKNIVSKMKNASNRVIRRFNIAKERISTVEITQTGHRVSGEETKYRREHSTLWGNIRWLKMNVIRIDHFRRSL